MIVLIHIPVEFEIDFFRDRFKDSLSRLICDANSMAGLYEKEVAEMLIQAFKEATYDENFIKWIK